MKHSRPVKDSRPTEALGTLLQPFDLSSTINGLDRTVDIGPVNTFGDATANGRLP